MSLELRLYVLDFVDLAALNFPPIKAARQNPERKALGSRLIEVSHEASNGWVHPGLYISENYNMFFSQIISALYTYTYY